MAFEHITVKLSALLEPVIVSMGFEPVGVVWLPQQGRATLRIYIDKPGGITIDDCSAVSRQVGSLLDVENPVAGEYNLEVSSPGIERPLFKLGDFERFVGRQVKIRLSSMLDDRKNWQGVIEKTDEKNVYLRVNESEVKLPFDFIDKANLVVVWDK